MNRQTLTQNSFGLGKGTIFPLFFVLVWFGFLVGRVVVVVIYPKTKTTML